MEDSLHHKCEKKNTTSADVPAKKLPSPSRTRLLSKISSGGDTAAYAGSLNQLGARGIRVAEPITSTQTLSNAPETEPQFRVFVAYFAPFQH